LLSRTWSPLQAKLKAGTNMKDALGITWRVYLHLSALILDNPEVTATLKLLAWACPFCRYLQPTARLPARPPAARCRLSLTLRAAPTRVARLQRSNFGIFAARRTTEDERVLVKAVRTAAAAHQAAHGRAAKANLKPDLDRERAALKAA
jgi:hypothetical protein